MSVRRIKTNSAVEVADVARWLPLIVEAIKGLKLQVKTENNVLYIALGSKAQLAIYPESESTGRFEKQVKQDNLVKVEEEGTYDSLKSLIEQITKASSGNSSMHKKSFEPVRPKTNSKQNSACNRQILRAGKNHQKFLKTKHLNASRNSKSKEVNVSMCLVNKPGNQTLNSSKKLQSLRASSTTDNCVAETICEHAGEIQTVQGVLFNVGEHLCIAFYDDIADQYIVQNLSIPENSQAFSTLEALITTVFGDLTANSIEPLLEEVNL